MRANSLTGSPTHSAVREQDVPAELESMFVKELLKASGAFASAQGSSTALYQDMVVDTLSHAVSQGGGVGLKHALAPASTDLLSAARQVVPEAQRITSGFGTRTDPFTGQQAHHQGVDLAAPEGSPIRAAAPGLVARAGEDPEYGKFVEVSHAGGQSTLYAHAQALAVKPGQAVQAGQVLGFVGETGRARGPHLHLEIRQDHHAVDPTRALIAYRRRVVGSSGEQP